MICYGRPSAESYDGYAICYFIGQSTDRPDISFSDFVFLWLILFLLLFLDGSGDPSYN
jgi:hypothetical protein